MRNLLALSLLFTAAAAQAEGDRFAGLRKRLSNFGATVTELGMAPLPETAVVKAKDEEQQSANRRRNRYPFKDADQILPGGPKKKKKPATTAPAPYPHKDADQMPRPAAPSTDSYPFKDADQILPARPIQPAVPPAKSSPAPSSPAPESYPYKDADQMPRPAPPAPPTGKGQDL